MLLLAFNSFEKPNRLQLYAKANPNTSKLSNDPRIGLKIGKTENLKETIRDCQQLISDSLKRFKCQKWVAIRSSNQ